MKIRNLLVAILAMSGTVVFAQEQRQIKEEGKTVFKPHWFIQAQVGAAHTVGEAKFTDLMSPAAAINIGYKFAPAFGARIGGSGWQAKGGWVTPEQTYQYKYLQGNIDIMADLSTLFCGFNPKRVFNGYLFGGVGLNRGFDNDEANALDTRTYELEYLWQEGKFLVAGRFGLGCDLRLNDRLAINIEANANALSDKFNSKKAGNADWQFNALIGLNIKFGKGYTETKPVYYEAEPVVVEQPKPVPVVEQPQPKKEVVVQPMKQDIFFALNSAKIQDDQKSKIDMLVEYLQNNPAAKVKVTGYADVNTGNPKINKSLSEKRAGNVADALKAKGITTDRIMVDSKGDTVQPYKAPEENRVSICIAE
jgi:outer membrane protein OmpA-like peptidoglycan-associated protein